MRMTYITEGAARLTQAIKLQPQQAPQVGNARLRIGLRRRDPPAQRRRVDKEDVPRDHLRVLLRGNPLFLLRIADQGFDAVDQPLADRVESRSLFAARVEGQFLQ